MLRVVTSPRKDWQRTVESQGLFFHSGDAPYWHEGAFYEFESPQVDRIEAATHSLNQMCLEAVQYVVDNRAETFPRFGIPEEFGDFVCASWDEDEHTVYGRLDLAYDGVGEPKLLEYNADTPTGLLEAAVIQHYWLKDLGGNFDQFNTIHERLIEAFARIKSDREVGGTPFYFTSISQDESVEDFMTATYLRDTAIQGGLATRYVPIEGVGFGEDSEFFRDDSAVIEHIFKLYPWEWLFREEFGKNLLTTATEWYEPAWKCVLSNKAILPVLYQLFGDSPYVLKAAYSQDEFGDTWVRKPIFSREGQNVVICKNGEVVADTPGEYGEFPVVYQEYHALPTFAGNRPVIGSWMVNGYAAGIGIRESEGLVTGNHSRFVPHRFAPSPAKGRFGTIAKKLLGK